MASKPEFVEFVAEQMRDAGVITYKKMFGEYGLYCDGRFFALICDDTLFIKKTGAGQKVCPGLEEAPPYKGARDHFLVEDVEDRELLAKLVTATCGELPEAKPKQGKRRKGPESKAPG